VDDIIYKKPAIIFSDIGGFHKKNGIKGNPTFFDGMNKITHTYVLRKVTGF
jgi:hypothetical protein